VIFESKATKTFFVSSASRTLIDCIAGASLTPEALAVRIEPLQATRVHYECDCMCMYIFWCVSTYIYICGMIGMIMYLVAFNWLGYVGFWLQEAPEAAEDAQEPALIYS